METEEIQKLSNAALMMHLETTCKSVAVLDVGAIELKAQYEALKVELFRRLMS